jgi:hypothetical protein
MSASWESGPLVKYMPINEHGILNYGQLGKTYRACLGMDGTGPDLKSQKIIFKINLNIFTFYITSITFYYYSNKKITTKKKTFLYKTFLFFSLHHSNLLQYQSTSSSLIHCQIQPYIALVSDTISQIMKWQIFCFTQTCRGGHLTG